MSNETNDEMMEVKATDLRPGDMVDLEHAEFFHGDDPDAPDPTESELGIVVEVNHDEMPYVLVIEFENIGTAGYAPDHVFTMKKRELAPAGWYEKYAD